MIKLVAKYRNGTKAKKTYYSGGIFFDKLASSLNNNYNVMKFYLYEIRGGEVVRECGK